jgi:hypothetical protein
MRCEPTRFDLGHGAVYHTVFRRLLSPQQLLEVLATLL